MEEEGDEPAIAWMLCDKVRRYCADHAQYQFDTKEDLASKCVLVPKCRQWIDAPRTVFVPFNQSDSTNKIVISFHYGRNFANTDNLSKGDLTVPR